MICLPPNIHTHTHTHTHTLLLILTHRHVESLDISGEWVVRLLVVTSIPIDTGWRVKANKTKPVEKIRAYNTTLLLLLLLLLCWHYFWFHFYMLEHVSYHYQRNHRFIRFVNWSFSFWIFSKKPFWAFNEQKKLRDYLMMV